MAAETSAKHSIPNLDGWPGLTGVFLFACMVIIARRPDAIFYPQFYTEDGQKWFADAYNMGWWRPLFQTHFGYFQTLPRLVAALALLLPLHSAPLVMNLIAILLQAVAAVLLMSSRSSGWGGVRFRAALVAIYLALPNNFEIGTGITESQWILALIAALLVVGSIPHTYKGKVFDVAVLTMGGLTGPFCLPLLLVASVVYWQRRDSWRKAQLCILGLAGLIQLCALLIVDPAGRHPTTLGANPELFIRILSGQVYLGTLLGHNGLSLRPGRSAFLFLICVAILGTVLMANCAAKASPNLRLFLAFSTILLGLSLASPMAKWQELAGAPAIRYWFFPTLAFAWSLLWCVQSRSQLLQISSGFLLFLMCVGVVRDFRHPAYTDEHFAQQLRRLESASPGTEITIPENPPGWSLRLVKR